MRALTNFFEKASLRKKALIAACLGIFGALAMPPLGFWPILFVIFPVLWIQLHSCLTTKQVFLMMWLFAFGYFTAGLYWIAAALFVDIAHNWWVLPFAVMGLPALMAFYPAAATALWHRLAWQGPARILLFIVLLSLSDIVRGTLFTGFPWNLWGYAWMDLLSVMQSVAWWGIYGQTLMTLLAVFAPLLWFQRSYVFPARVFVVAFGMVLLFAVLWGHGRLSQHYPMQPKQMMVRIVQPNIPQEAKWDAEQRAVHEQDIWRLTSQSAMQAPNIIIWPETAVTLVGTDDVRRMEEKIQTQLFPQAVLAMGVLDVGWDNKADKPVFYNRIGFYNATMGRLDAYDKTHLVPFGEYLPYQEYWPVRPVAFQAGRFSPGSGVQTIHLPNLPGFSPLICYEVLFPGDVAAKKDRPQWLLNVTNDAWYGKTSGPYQHLAIARTRAIEEGVPLVRAANTGVSAVIDPLGRIADMLPLGTQGVIDAPLPPALDATFYARHGQAVFYMMCVFLLGLASVWQLAQRKKIPHV